MEKYWCIVCWVYYINNGAINEILINKNGGVFLNIFVIGLIFIVILIVAAIICRRFGKLIWGGIMCFLGLGLLAIGIYLWQASMWRDISFLFLITGALLECITIMFAIRVLKKNKDI